MDTLAFGYILPTTGRIRDFNPLETCAARRTYVIKPPAFKQAARFFTFRSIGRRTIAEYLIISNRIAVLTNRIPGVALDRVNSAVFHLLNDTRMVG